MFMSSLSQGYSLDSTGNYNSITMIDLSLPMETIQSSRDYWSKN